MVSEGDARSLDNGSCHLGGKYVRNPNEEVQVWQLVYSPRLSR